MNIDLSNESGFALERIKENIRVVRRSNYSETDKALLLSIYSKQKRRIENQLRK